MLLPMWLMLLPLLCRLDCHEVADVIATFFFVADVITTSVYCVLADVIAMVVDVKTTQGR